MSIITSRIQKFQLEAQGKGFSLPFITAANSATTLASGVAASGWFTVQIKANSIGTTYPSTIQGFPLPAGTNPLRLSTIFQSGINVPTYLAYIYKIGTQVLTTTGDQFTHDAATFPLLRTVMGQANSPISLIPMFQITTATTTTPAVLTLKTAAGAAGYTDQDGNATIGSRTFTMPAAATSINSCYFPRLEIGDYGVRNINAIQTNTAAAAGAMTVWGVELLCPVAMFESSGTGFADAFFGGLTMANLRPAVATSGTVTSALVLIDIGNTGATNNHAGYLTAVSDT